MRLFSYIFLFLLTTWQLIAQTYPVQVVPMLTPPYSSKIADYANPMANRVQLQLITTDLSVQNRSVQLYVEIKGNGLTAASAPVLSGVSPLRINGGEILRLTNAELASYFQLRNLQGITSQQYTSALPDGMYSFCFRVKDVLSGRWLSQSHCAIAYLMLNDPPILNIPTDNEQVAVTDFQNIIFSWTPRQINATNITYSFELREILDPTLDPRFAFEVSRRILKEDDLRMTTFVYDVSKPNLIPGRRYAWRVRAISTGGLAENSVFKNDGYSEVHSFVYAVNCSKPLFLLSQQQGKNRTKLLWQGHTLHQKYHIQYRKKGVANAQWFEASTRNTQTLITDLEAGEYEFRVGATCETERYGIKPSYVYSDIQTFKIEKTQSTTESAYNCGIVPKIAITNQKPLGSLVTNEVFVAGDFSVTILEVSGNNGIFSGKGFIKVPYLNDTKLAVEFENVKINADYQLTDGVVKTTYDSDWKGVQEIKSFNEVINNLKTIFKKKKLTEEDLKSLQELKKQWDFYLSNANGIGISEEDKTAFKEIGAKMFSASVEKLSKEERKALLENTEKAEKLYDKYKDKFEQYTAKKEEEAHDDVQINEIVEALLNLKGKAFLKCKKCEEKPIKYTEGNYNNQILNLNTKKNNFKCILGEYDHKNNVNIITLQRKKESSVGKNEVPTTKIEQYIKSIQDKKDSFLLIAQENDDLLECTNRLTFSKNFCSVKETETITKEDEKHIIEELKNCLNNNQAVISLEELKNIEKELLEIKKQLNKEQAFEWTYKGKIYKLNAKNKVEEVQNPLSNADIIKGNWKGMQEEKKRFYRNEEGFIQLSAFGYRSDLPILEGKKADLEEISKHILNQTNAYFSDLRSLSQQAPQLDEDAFADGKKIEIRKNATKFQVFIEGIDITKNLIKTGKVVERVYLDKTNEEAYIKVPGIVTGSTEAGLSVITDITAAVVMIYDIAVDEEVRKETYNGLVKIKDEIKENPSQLFPLLKDVILEAVTGNTSEDWGQTTQEETDKGKKSHLLSKGAVKTTMSVVVGGKILAELPKAAEKLAIKITAIKKAIKEADDLKDVAKRIVSFTSKTLDDKLKEIADAWKKFYPEVFAERKFFEDLMAIYRYKAIDGWVHTSDIAPNFKAVDFYKGIEINGLIDASEAISMKTTKVKDVKQWLNSGEIQKNIRFLKEGLDNTKGIKSNNKILFFEKAKVDIYMPKENISEDLLNKWNKELSKITKDTNIEFEIRSLEEFIK